MIQIIIIPLKIKKLKNKMMLNFYVMEKYRFLKIWIEKSLIARFFKVDDL